MCFGGILSVRWAGVMKAAVAVAACKGRPADAVECREVAAATFDEADERPLVRVHMAYAAVHPADLNVLEGTYMHKVERYPSGAIGYEGSGVVAALSRGAAAEGVLSVGDRVVPRVGGGAFGLTGGAWCAEVVSPAAAWVKIPATLTLQQAALVGANPATAYLMLKHGGLTLREGEWIVQNIANSAVGVAVARLAKVRSCERN